MHVGNQLDFKLKRIKVDNFNSLFLFFSDFCYFFVFALYCHKKRPGEIIIRIESTTNSLISCPFGE